MKNDSLGDRMKNQYEHRFKTFLPRRTYTIIRLDGKAFHSYTKNCERPYDLKLMSDMDNTAKHLCENIQGCKLAYVQSDEITIVLTDFENTTTDAWFDGNIQKMTSISASMAAAKFNQLRMIRECYQYDLEYPYKAIDEDKIKNIKLACFDSRVFIISEAEEVLNCLIWRQQDATRNSIQMTGQAHFSHKKLQNKSCENIQEMLWSEKNINWNDLPTGFKRGRCIVKEEYEYEVPAQYRDEATEEDKVLRHRWIIVDPPIFTQDRNWAWNYIPKR
jgi:tRNA(His) 5'-end guanylyltransferase